MMQLGRYWHTVRYLRPAQLIGRVTIRLRRARIDGRSAPARRAVSLEQWVPCVPRPVSLIAPDRLLLLNEAHSLGDHGWDDPALPRLWRYNLHYFDDLLAPRTPERDAWQQDLLLRWIRENPPGVGTGWESYPTSLRIVNWVKWSFAGNTLPDQCVQSLATQARWLARRLETHLLGNHLFANAKALVFGGCFFSGDEADAWLDRGLEILAREVSEQILEDGGQFERSPMYHALALEDLLDLTNVVSLLDGKVSSRLRRAIEEWPDRIRSMRRWLLAMSHPDGHISFFNDAALGVAASPAELEAYAERLGVDAPEPSVGPLTALRETGYVRVARSHLVAILDVGEIGPDYLPAHAHADTLSFEASIFGQRVFVNSGISQYAGGDERRRQRGTAAHNTVVVDGQDSSEVWAEFRVARRARPVDLQVLDAEPITVMCAHTGYQRLTSRPRHSRTWTFGQSSLVISDHVSGSFGHGEARYHLHPDVAVESVGSDSRSWRLRLPRGESVLLSVVEGRARREPGTWHPGFGQTVPATIIAVELEGHRASVRADWDVSP